MAWWKYDAVTGMLTVGTDTTNPIQLALDPTEAEAAWIPVIDAIYEAENQYDGLANVKSFVAEALNGQSDHPPVGLESREPLRHPLHRGSRASTARVWQRTS